MTSLEKLIVRIPRFAQFGEFNYDDHSRSWPRLMANYSLFFSSVTLNMTMLLAFGRGCSCFLSFQSLAIQFLLCCASNRWSSFTGTITSQCSCTRGSRTLNTLLQLAGSSSWTTAFTHWCTRTTLYVPSNSARHVQSPWLSPSCNLHKWLLDVLSMSGRMDSCSKPATLPAISHPQTLSSRLPCMPATSFFLLVSSTWRTCQAMHVKARSSRHRQWRHNKQNNWTTRSKRIKADSSFTYIHILTTFLRQRKLKSVDDDHKHLSHLNNDSNCKKPTNFLFLFTL